MAGMKIGDFTIQEVIFGHFRLDGGCMFGSVPKNLWSKSISADAENCIHLVCRSLLITHSGRRFLVDVGMGEKWNDKQRQIYGIKNTPKDQWGFDPGSITDVILTHLHFDHAGGITSPTADGGVTLSFPQATIHLQKANWEHALNPTPKDKASYLVDNVKPLAQAKLKLYEGTEEIAPGLRVHRVDGHTKGQQWIEIASEKERILFATDLIPTAHHVPLAYHMGYDVCAETLLAEKASFLEQALQDNAWLCFQHDADTCLAQVIRNERGHYECSHRRQTL
jgi:glyoxylase-like metal-dependent hydrolase (beta-lactamase superfamily II)